MEQLVGQQPVIQIEPSSQAFGSVHPKCLLNIQSSLALFLVSLF